MGGCCARAAGKGQYLAPLTPSLCARERHRSWRGQIAIKALSRSGESVRLMRPKRLKYLPRCPSDCQRGKNSEISAKSLVLTWRLAVSPRKRTLCYKILTGKKGSLRLEPSSTSDKRDDVSAHALRIGGCPVCHPAS